MAIASSSKGQHVDVEARSSATCVHVDDHGNNIELKDLVEVDKLQKIVEDFYQITSMGIAIIRIDGELIAQAGWHNICTQFHRKDPESLKNCMESEIRPAMHLEEGRPLGYRCKNLVRHVVTPIFMEGQHVGNVFLGQFFYDDEDIDTDLFVEQAERYGFEKEEYMAALDTVPRWSRGKVEASVRFCVDLSTLISTLYMSKLRLMRENSERRKVEEAYKRASEKQNLLGSITRHDINNQLIVLKGNLELAKNHVKDEAILARLNKIEKATDNIWEQLSFTKDYQNLGTVAPCWQRVSELVIGHRKVLDIKQVQICERGRNLELFADPMLGKVFYNLLENSVKHGGKPIIASFYCQDGDNGDLLVIYEDNGIGIPDSDKLHIFERGFGRGTGLGLFLSREILAITGITIVENGEPGKGARFEMRIPNRTFRFRPSEPCSEI